MTIKSGQIGAQIGGNALSQRGDKELYGRFPGPHGPLPGEVHDSSAVERVNALHWALKNPVAETPDMVVARAEAYRLYLTYGPSKAQ